MTKSERIISEVRVEVSPFGNGAHVTVPKEWIGEMVKVVRIKED